MKVVDELFTPGCPQCAVKHLSAALYHAATFGRVPYRLDTIESMVMLARAYINLGEVLIGYRSHLWFAVGLLQRSEELALTEGSVSSAARQARLTLELRGMSAVRETMRSIKIDAYLDPATMCMAHIDEAMRELPSFSWAGTFDDIPATIDSIRKEYFDSSEEAPGASAEAEEEGGEEAMACGTKKAAKAACKGGKCAPAKKAPAKKGKK